MTDTQATAGKTQDPLDTIRAFLSAACPGNFVLVYDDGESVRGCKRGRPYQVVGLLETAKEQLQRLIATDTAKLYPRENTEAAAETPRSQP